jgi:hypothetical protein
MIDYDSLEVARGTTCKDHTPCPTGYLQWTTWSGRMMRTHHQRRCAECRDWKIWIPKKRRAGAKQKNGKGHR